MQPTIETAEGLRPIGDDMPAAVRAIADAAILNQGGDLRQPNRVKMRAFIDRGVAEADKVGGSAGAELLNGYIAAVHANRNALADWATDRIKTLPKGLDGLTIFDIDDAQFQLEAAQRRLRQAVAS